jgi:ADP-ribosylglycohydrolase
MRTAALGLAFLGDPSRLPDVVADVSRITHRDPRSIAGGVAIAKAAQLLASSPADDPAAFCSAIADSVCSLSSELATWVDEMPELLWEPAEAVIPVIAWAGMPAPEFDAPIITPFVIPTVLAALWSLLSHPASWAGAVTRAIRLGGDVDTLGAIVGALAGVRLGVGCIPAHLRRNVRRSRQLEVLEVRYYELVRGQTG